VIPLHGFLAPVDFLRRAMLLLRTCRVLNIVETFGRQAFVRSDCRTTA
jgi:hypothetical protein